MSPPTIACKVCGSPTALICRTPNEHSESRELAHHRCSDCGLVFVGNELTDDELGRAYASLDTGAYYEETAAEARSKFTSGLQDLERFLGGRRDARILDIGTGNGGFPALLLEEGYTELSAHDVPGNDFGRLAGTPVTIYRDFDYGSIPSETFDVVTLMDVAEHVKDPSHLFSQCRRALRPGGILYLHVPVVTPTDRLMHGLRILPGLSKIGRAWQRGRTSVFHLQNYTPRALERVMNVAGFDDVHVRCKNELSWPVSRYVRVYVCEKQGLPGALAPILTPLLYPLLATDLLNPNKAIASGRASTRRPRRDSRS